MYRPTGICWWSRFGILMLVPRDGKPSPKNFSQSRRFWNVWRSVMPSFEASCSVFHPTFFASSHWDLKRFIPSYFAGFTGRTRVYRSLMAAVASSPALGPFLEGGLCREYLIPEKLAASSLFRAALGAHLQEPQLRDCRFAVPAYMAEDKSRRVDSFRAALAAHS